MVLAKSKNAVGLGNSLMNDRYRQRNSNMHRQNAGTGGIERKDQDGNSYITPGKKEAEWVKMRSVTEQGALDEFLSTAELAGTDFTAEKMSNVKIIHRDQKNPYLLSREEERGVLRKQNAKRARLTVPRRPKWDESTTPQELHEREKASLLEWRRGLAELQEVEDLLMTPFERNLEVWRQLWRVIERSDLVVQIVDARNPLLFRCEDLEKYVKEVDGRKRNLLLVNKADMMTEEQRTAWAEYFVAKGINFRFFSAELARELNEAREADSEDRDEVRRSPDNDEAETDESQEEDDDNDEDELDAEKSVPDDDSTSRIVDPENDKLTHEAAKIELEERQEEESQWTDEETMTDEVSTRPVLDAIPTTLDEQTRILTTSDLEELFLAHSSSAPSSVESRKTSIGLVGYPNVGKSSTINALLGAKKVSVSATPGKTKHFQTIHLSPRVILCDCPGLVFPNFATTKAELVCNGVLPIDQLREYSGPATLVAQRIPQSFLEALYGMKIQTRPLEEGGTGTPTGAELLRGYARARGFFTQGLGQPDESRAARSVLKDYVKGKLLFVHPPPSEPAVDGKTFNRELYDLAHLPLKRGTHAAASTIAVLDNTSDPSLMDHAEMIPLPAPQGQKGQRLDKQFFAPGQGNGVQVKPFHYKYSEQGKELTGRKLKAVKALEQDVDPADLKVSSKKHFKGGKKMRGKVRGDNGQGGGDYE